MKFKNPANEYVEESGTCFLWALLFGGFYFAYKGIWSHFVISVLLAFATAGISWLIYPFFAGKVVRQSYLRKGWVEVAE